MGELINKMKQKAACVYSIIIACGKRIAVIFAKFENWLWGLEDRLPRLKNICLQVFSFLRKISDGITSAVDCLIEKIKSAFLTLKGKIKQPQRLDVCREKFNDIRVKSDAHLPKNKMLLVLAVVEVLIAVWGIAMQADILFVCVILLWTAIVIFAFAKMEQRAMLLMLSLAFFVFLIGRDFLQQFLHYQLEDFSADVRNHTYISVFLALLGLFGGYWIIKRKTPDNVYVEKENSSSVLQCSKFVLFIVLVPAVIYRLILTVYVQQHGYAAYYTDFAVLLNNNIFLYILSKVEQMAPACMCIYIAAMPKKKDFFKVAAFYLVYLVLTLGAGTRSPFLLGIFLFLFYFLYRAGLAPKEGWFRRQYILPCVVVMGVLACVLYFAGLIRDGVNSTGNSLLDGILGFVYSQGVSVNVIKRGYMFQDMIPEGYLYSMDFTRYGLIARILGITVYSGNTVEQALYGGSFAHALSYIFLGDAYLAGRGTGTSYVAELYHDFGYIGIVIGSVIYGWLCTGIESYKEGKVFRRSCLFIIITQLLWAPRGGFTKIITTLLSPSALLALLAVFAMAWLLERRKQWRTLNAGKETDGNEEQ